MSDSKPVTIQSDFRVEDFTRFEGLLRDLRVGNYPAVVCDPEEYEGCLRQDVSQLSVGDKISAVLESQDEFHLTWRFTSIKTK